MLNSSVAGSKVGKQFFVCELKKGGLFPINTAVLPLITSGSHSDTTTYLSKLITKELWRKDFNQGEYFKSFLNALKINQAMIRILDG